MTEQKGTTLKCLRLAPFTSRNDSAWQQKVSVTQPDVDFYEAMKSWNIRHVFASVDTFDCDLRKWRRKWRQSENAPTNVLTYIW